MFFDDKFKYNEEETNRLIKIKVLDYIYKNINCTKHSEIEIENNIVCCSVFSGVSMLEAVLKSLDITSFDFLNNDTVMKIERAFDTTIRELIKKGFLTTSLEGKDKFYNMFIRKQLFRMREFSNEFEVDLIANLMYRLGFSFKYNVKCSFIKYYKNFITDDTIKNYYKKIVIDLADEEEVVVFLIKEIFEWKDIKNVVQNNDYSSLCDFVSIYESKTKSIKIVPTRHELEEYHEKLFSKIVLIVNTDSKIRKQFEN